MPLPPLVKQLVEKKLSAYCQRKIPAHLHNEIRLGFKFRGNTVTLFAGYGVTGYGVKSLLLTSFPCHLSFHEVHFERIQPMPLPPLVKQLVEKKLSAYCQRKIPAHLHNEIRLGFKFRGNTVTLFESRPAFGMPGKWVEMPVAQFRYDPDDNLWTLYCADRNSRWHPDMEIDPVKDFDRLLQEIDRDPTGIYWG